MTPEDARMLAELADAEARATKAPWEALAHELHFDDCILSDQIWSSDGRIALTESRRSKPPRQSADDAAFIVSARNALPRLLALVKEQDAALRHAAVIACAPSARYGVVMAGALAGLRKALDTLVPGWNHDGLAALGVFDAEREEKTP